MMASDEHLSLPPVVVEVAPDEVMALAAAEDVAAGAAAGAAAEAAAEEAEVEAETAAVAAAAVAPAAGSSNSSSKNNNLVVAIAGHALRHGVGVLSWMGDAIGEPIVMRPDNNVNDNSDENNHAAAAAAAEKEVEEDEEEQQDEEEPAEMPLAGDPMAPGSRGSSWTVPLSILAFAVCFGMVSIAGIGVTFDAGEEVSTPATCVCSAGGHHINNVHPTTTTTTTITGGWFSRSYPAAPAVDTTAETSEQRVYNIHVYEGCGRRNGAVDVVVTAGSKSSSPPPPSPPSPLLSDVESRTNIFSPLASQVPKLFSRVFPLPVSSTTGDSGIGCCGNSDNTGGSGGSDAGASGSDGDDNGDKDVQADLSFFAYNPWTVEGQAAAQALLDGPWV